jgi:hypothetical protein
MPTKVLYKEEGPLKGWDQIYGYYWKTFVPENEHWIFKGHANSVWYLRPTLERAFIRYFGQPITATGPKREEELDSSYRQISLQGVGDKKKCSLRDIEKGLLRDFKRKCHLYLQDVPPDEYTLEWLTLMQHHGAPTRLLDFTYSFFVALYFAIRDCDTECAVWAIDKDFVSEKNRSLYKNPGKKKRFKKAGDATTRAALDRFFQTYFWKPKRAMTGVELLNTFRLNQRLIAQQGVFLCPGDIEVPFSDNLYVLLQGRPAPDKFVKLRITATIEERTDILRHLHKMNITTATLFPGLDGFAKSVADLLVFPNMLKPEPFCPSP